MTVRRRQAPAPFSARETAVLVAVAVLATVVFLAFAAVARFLPTGGWETQVVVLLALGSDPAADAVRLFNRLGNLDAWLVLVAGTAAAVGLARGGRAALLVLASFAVDIANFAFKALVERARPDLGLAQGLFGLDDHGFPSGHTARAAALAGAVLLVLVPARWRLTAALAGAALTGLAMGYARVALGVHFPLDTLGGLALGIGWVALMALLVLRRA